MKQLSKISTSLERADYAESEAVNQSNRLTYDQVLQKLLILETVQLAKDVEKSVVQVWLSLMNSEGVTSKEWATVISQVAKTKTFIVKPNEVIDAVKEIRRAARLQLKDDYYSDTMVEIQVGDATPTLVPYWRIKDGRVLPDGQRNPDALPPSAAKALPSAPVSDEQRREVITRMAERAGLESAAHFIQLVRSQGGNVDVEVGVVRKLRAEELELKEETDRQEDADQKERIRRQVENLKREQVSKAPA